MHDRLTYQERDLALNSYSSSINFETAKQIIDFPKNLERLTVLDIGGGASTVTLDLKEKGARAIAIDYRYQDVINLQSSVNRFISGDLREKISQAQDEQSQAMLLTPPQGLDTQLWQNSVILAWAVRRGSTAIDTAMESLSKIRFFAAYQRGEKPYLAGSACNLPFADSSIDFCFSIRCLIPFLVQKKELFIQSVAEALRVLKPQGELQIHPWVDQNGYFPQDIKQNADYLLTLLKKEAVPHSVETTSPYFLPRLRITKA